MPRIKGRLISLSIHGVKIACEVESDFTFDVEGIGASSVESGRWRDIVPGIRSWQMSVNGNLLSGYTGVGFNEILSVLISGELCDLVWQALDGSVVISGKGHLLGGGGSAPANSLATWNASFTGSGPVYPNSTPPVELTVKWTFQKVDPSTDPGNLSYKFNKSFNPDQALTLDFTKLSAGNYLAFSVPTGYPLFNVWENNFVNFGTVPDFVWKAPVTVSGRDIYFTRDLIYFTSEVPSVVFKNRSTTPNNFVFNDVTSALRSTEYVSNEIIVSGITEPVPISVTGGMYALNGGAYTAADGYVSAGTKVRVKLISSSAYLTTVAAILTIGGVTDSYDVTTQADATLYYAYATGMFVKQCTLPQIGNSVPFSRTYTGATQEAADSAKTDDAAQFLLDGQANANAYGTCSLPGVPLWGKITEENVQTDGLSTYATIMLRIYKGTSTTVAPSPVPEDLAPLPLPSIVLEYRQEGEYPAAPFSWSQTTLNQSEIQVITPNPPFDPSINPLYPKQLIAIHEGDTYMYVAAPGKLRDEMFYIGSY